jgi:hypothetical protein
MYEKYEEEVVRNLVASSMSFRQVLISLGKAPVGGNSNHIRRLCEKWGIDTSHMTGQAHNKGKCSNKKKDPITRLVMRSKLEGRQKVHYLREGLLTLGREEKCEDCGITDQWNGKSIKLEIDHRDGQFWNDTPVNLRFLCPNCHSQYPTR